MINQLTTAQLNGQLGNTPRNARPSQCSFPPHELGYLPIDSQGRFAVPGCRRPLCRLIDRADHESTAEWGTLFDVDNTLATALIDRLIIAGEAIVIQGAS